MHQVTIAGKFVSLFTRINMQSRAALILWGKTVSLSRHARMRKFKTCRTVWILHCLILRLEEESLCFFYSCLLWFIDESIRILLPDRLHIGKKFLTI